jgi:hypothetical protein
MLPSGAPAGRYARFPGRGAVYYRTGARRAVPCLRAPRSDRARRLGSFVIRERLFTDLGMVAKRSTTRFSSKNVTPTRYPVGKYITKAKKTLVILWLNTGLENPGRYRLAKRESLF